MKRQTKKDREDERVAMHRKSGKYEPSAKGRRDESKAMKKAMSAHDHMKEAMKHIRHASRKK